MKTGRQNNLVHDGTGKKYGFTSFGYRKQRNESRYKKSEMVPDIATQFEQS
jgi:hypothetical protein